jgi:hypothetical protein
MEEDPRRRTRATGEALRIFGSMADPGHRDGAEELVLGARREAEVLLVDGGSTARSVADARRRPAQAHAMIDD